MEDSHRFDGHSLIRPETIAEYAKETEGDAVLGGDLLSEVLTELDELHASFSETGDAGLLAARTVSRLHEIRASMPAAAWRALAPAVTSHRLVDHFLQDPFTRWSHRKPREYSGDAGLLDFIYGHAAVQPEISSATAVGRSLYAYTRNAPSCVAVRERRRLLAQFVDAVAETKDGAEVMAIAAGHLRESELSSAAREGRLRRWIALDQDPLSLEEVAASAPSCVEGVRGSVRDIIARPKKYGQFDLVYSAGLYDYLEDKVAVRMTRKCLEMLKRGGTYLFANFADDIPDDGYMETFMRWELILRSREDMLRIIDESVGAEHESRIFTGENGCVIYAAIMRVH